METINQTRTNEVKCWFLIRGRNMIASQRRVEIKHTQSTTTCDVKSRNWSLTILVRSDFSPLGQHCLHAQTTLVGGKSSWQCTIYAIQSHYFALKLLALVHCKDHLLLLFKRYRMAMKDKTWPFFKKRNFPSNICVFHLTGISYLSGLDHPQPAKVAPITQPSLLEIMRQQEEEEVRLANEAASCPPTGYERLLKEAQVAPSGIKKARVCSPENPSHGGRLRKIGTPGPMEKSFEQSQEMLSKVKTSTSKHISPVEVNRAAENIIASLSDDGQFVSLEKVKAKLCVQFGKPSVNALGFKKDKDIPALNDLIQLQNKVSTL